MNDEVKKSSGTVRLTDSHGREWPCRLTLGALRRYKQETGEDASQLKGESSLGVLLWCCVKSACQADGVPMDVGLDEFLEKPSYTTGRYQRIRILNHVHRNYTVPDDRH